ncbi:MAG: cbb3-type cytochrome c oxidase subunit I [Pseudomonadota bacterium]
MLSIDFKSQFSKQIFILWFILATLALAFSGIYSFFPYLFRTPFFGSNAQNLFNLSLMVHVNLGVLVWFLSSTSMLMNLIIKESLLSFSFIAFLSSMAGTIFIIISPFIGESEPVKNDYIPILHNFVFILGISLFLSGVLLQVILALLSYLKANKNLLNFTILISAIIFIISCVCLIQAASQLRILTQERFVDLLEYYQLLFWGTGHVLQFNYVQLIIIAWLIIANPKPSLSLYLYQWINLVLIIPSIMVYWFYQIDSYELYNFFTLHMKYIGGILLLIMAIKCFLSISRNILDFRILSFYSSIFLILSGGTIGYLIDGANVTIPAHYHGVILGITVGLMGLFYLLLPKLGFRKVNEKYAKMQIMLYTLGQFIHITALAISGGYGVLRKDPEATLSAKAKIFMGAMGIGGSIALIGGVLFVVLIFKSLIVNNEKQTN